MSRNNITFEDNSIKIKNILNRQCVAYLYEAAGELEAQVKRNTAVDSSSLKGSWKYKVDESAMVATIGSPQENAIWEEFGTGEYALNGDGRKGWWVYVKGSNKKSHSPKQYTEEKARQVVAILRSKGLEAYMTKGKHPKRAFQKAFTSKKQGLIRRFASIISQGFER
ncbi:HK97 gp10 family phage protein [Listeria monocytogenes]